MCKQSHNTIENKKVRLENYSQEIKNVNSVCLSFYVLFFQNVIVLVTCLKMVLTKLP